MCRGVVSIDKHVYAGSFIISGESKNEKLMRNFQSPGRSLVFGGHAMCATSHPLASRCAMQTLDKGGNAVDAAVSANRALLVAANPSIPAHRAADQSTIESTVIQIRKANQQ